MTDDLELGKAKKQLYNLLLAPYNESSHYQITAACTYLNHPLRPPRKFQENQRCICGMVKGKEIA